MRVRNNGRPGFGRGILLGIGILAGGLAQASTPPDWLVPLINLPPAAAQPDGSALVLREEITVRYLPEGKLRETFRQVIKAVTADGVRLANPAHAYNADTDRILRANAWVVSPDGQQTEHYDRTSFVNGVLQPSDYIWSSSRVLWLGDLRQLTVGGIVAVEEEFEHQTGMTDYSWCFLGPRPVASSVFEVIPLPGEQIVYHATSASLPAPVAGSEPGSLRWEVRNRATLPRNMPAGFIPNPQQIFVRSVGPDSPAGRMQTWGQFASLAAAVIEPRIVASPEVVAHAQALVATAGDRWSRIRALAGNVQKEIDYLSLTLDKDSLAGLRPHLPAEVLASRLGDCKDKGTLLIAMLRSLGEKAFPVLVSVNTDRSDLPAWPSQAFDHYVVGIAAGADVPPRWPVIDGGAAGPLVVFDPTDPFTPLGALPFADQGRSALVLAPGVQDTLKLPSEDPGIFATTRHWNTELAPNGNLTAQVEILTSGATAAAVAATRIKLGDDRFGEQLEAGYHRVLPFLTDLSWTGTWTPDDASNHLTCKFKAAHAMRTMGSDALLVCPRLVAGDFPYTPWKTDWEGGVWVHSSGSRDEVRIRLPEGYRHDKLPADVHEELPFVNASLSYRLDGDTLVYTRQYFRKGGLLNKSAYDALCRLHRKLDEAERRPLIIYRLTGPAQPATEAGS